LGIGLMLEANHYIIGVTHYDHVAPGLAPSPAFGSRSTQVDVCKERRCHRSLVCPLLAYRDDSIFEDARFQPFLDQADDTRVTDPVLQEAEQPLLGNFVEERSDVGVQYVVYLCVGDPDDQCVQRIMLAGPRPEPIREPEEALLVERSARRPLPFERSDGTNSPSTAESSAR
jgi:hypothetical protein